MTGSTITIDTRDDRQQIYELIHRLPPKRRIEFLVWVCQQVPQNEKGHLPVPVVTGLQTTCEYAYRNEDANARLSREVYIDVLSLIVQFSVDDKIMACTLEKWVKFYEKN